MAKERSRCVNITFLLLLTFEKKSRTSVYLSLSLGFSGGVMLYISFVALLPNGINGVGELWGISAFFIGIKLNWEGILIVSKSSYRHRFMYKFKVLNDY